MLVLWNSIFSCQLGKKAYELKDHLGNIRVTHSDIKMPTDTTKLNVSSGFAFIILKAKNP